MMTGHVSVAIYSNITSENLKAVIENSKASLAFLGRVDCDDILLGKDSKTKVVLFSSRDETYKPKDKVLNWKDIQNGFEEFKGSPRRKMSDLATIIYTSGTTSKPKGVMHSFGGLAFIADKVKNFVTTTPGDRLFSYGTLAHVSERLSVEVMALHYGLPIYFSESREHFLRDLKTSQPSSLFANPLTWRKIKSYIQTVFSDDLVAINGADDATRMALQDKLKAKLGFSSLRTAFVGASPIEKETLHWYADKLGLSIAEGYGMSETLGLITVNTEGAAKYGSVGQVFDFCDVKISENSEVLVKHDGLTLGYYENEKKTKDLFDKDGYLKTGDEGYFKDGSLYITGRIGDSFKTAQSNWIYPASLESKLTVHDKVVNACVIGAGRMQPFAVIDICPSVSGEGKIEQAKRDIGDYVTQMNSKLEPRERLDRVVVTGFSWTTENRFMTSTMKVSRRYIQDRYEQLEAASELLVEVHD